MPKAHEFVVVTYINSTPERVWAALTSQEFGRKTLGPFETDWKTGSVIKAPDATGNDKGLGVVLLSMPPRILSYTRTSGRNDRVTWLIEQCDSGTVKLKVIHDNLAESQRDDRFGEFGWVLMTSVLKTRLESEPTQGVSHV